MEKWKHDKNVLLDEIFSRSDSNFYFDFALQMSNKNVEHQSQNHSTFSGEKKKNDCSFI